jgi:hypothetical protein
MRRCISLLVVAFVACLFLNVPRTFAVSSDEASLAFSIANNALGGAFTVVSDARQAGANVSGLMERLNAAGTVLSSAEAALEMKNYTDVVSRADSCKNLITGIVEDANTLKTNTRATSSSWWITLSFSIVGVVVFVVGLFLVWRWFKGYYKTKLLDSKPEVVG